jgi:hypothetical protein
LTKDEIDIKVAPHKTLLHSQKPFIRAFVDLILIKNYRKFMGHKPRALDNAPGVASDTPVAAIAIGRGYTLASP